MAKDRVLDFFKEISEVPRCSGKEQRIRQFLKKFAKENKLNFKQDSYGNCIIYKAGSKGTVVLQAHLDMVCEKEEEFDFDFSKKGPEIKIKRGWLTANHTTLGADNGIGVAMILDILSQKKYLSFVKGLFTVEEEIGLKGAKYIEGSFLEGSYLINCDGGGDDTIVIGSADGIDVKVKIPLKRKNFSKGKIFDLKITGLMGGHSGLDIGLKRANAIKIAAEVILKISGKNSTGIYQFEGGTKINAIPRNAEVVFSTKKTLSQIKKIIKNVKKRHSFEKNLKIEICEEKNKKEKKAIDEKGTKRILKMLLDFPHGVFVKKKGAVLSSSNLARIFIRKNQANIEFFLRSLYEKDSQELLKKISDISTQNKGVIVVEKLFPSWNLHGNSRILRKAVRVYKELFKKAPQIKEVHAGIECAYFYKKHPQLEIISIGPSIKNLHTPYERVKISSVKKTTRFLKELILTLSDESCG